MRGCLSFFLIYIVLKPLLFYFSLVAVLIYLICIGFLGLMLPLYAIYGNMLLWKNLKAGNLFFFNLGLLLLLTLFFYLFWNTVTNALLVLAFNFLLLVVINCLSVFLNVVTNSKCKYSVRIGPWLVLFKLGLAIS